MKELFSITIIYHFSTYDNKIMVYIKKKRVTASLTQNDRLGQSSMLLLMHCVTGAITLSFPIKIFMQ